MAGWLRRVFARYPPARDAAQRAAAADALPPLTDEARHVRELAERAIATRRHPGTGALAAALDALNDLAAHPDIVDLMARKTNEECNGGAGS